MLDVGCYGDTEFGFLDGVLHMQCTVAGLVQGEAGRDTLAASLRQLAVAARQANRHQVRP